MASDDTWFIQHVVKPHLFYRSDRRAVEVVVVLPGLDKFMILDVGLHDLSRLDEMVVAAIHLKINKNHVFLTEFKLCDNN